MRDELKEKAKAKAPQNIFSSVDPCYWKFLEDIRNVENMLDECIELFY